ncbi:MAG: hypothetical protein SPJ55_13205 [Treponema sp.]|nr:hypothetical protein [Treponema sp.]
MFFSASSSLYEQDFSIKVIVPSTESKLVTSPQPFENDLTSVELTKKIGFKESDVAAIYSNRE